MAKIKNIKNVQLFFSLNQSKYASLRYPIRNKNKEHPFWTKIKQ